MAAEEEEKLLEINSVSFTWSNINVSANNKNILRNASGRIKSGELLAVLGASGAGKSTLLNAITFRNLGGLKIESRNCEVNGKAVDKRSEMAAFSAYIEQIDLFLLTLTVKETLKFHSSLRH